MMESALKAAMGVALSTVTLVARQKVLKNNAVSVELMETKFKITSWSRKCVEISRPLRQEKQSLLLQLLQKQIKH
jgi:hypothetical protein